jgi:hypothetical protein
LLGKYKILNGFAANNPAVLKVEPSLILIKEEKGIIKYSIEK